MPYNEKEKTDTNTICELTGNTTFKTKKVIIHRNIK
jgi:hypothetical protein